ncbi:hypothetical protein NDU88_005025 [Pleurodeles waltl]|uniref:Uncharacterized protein n=1 Tax=Pleurodeles waltl TaxID=8319 RepID=A0AAV7UHN4_PLEWA|nr:hypothetical protein NDU88_005025 [Pleurodeles waltl]
MAAPQCPVWLVAPRSPGVAPITATATGIAAPPQWGPSPGRAQAPDTAGHAGHLSQPPLHTTPALPSFMRGICALLGWQPPFCMWCVSPPVLPRKGFAHLGTLKSVSQAAPVTRGGKNTWWDGGLLGSDEVG